ncbi:uncharacterized protein LOC129754722 isoform X2 [Uranotaenia lowii]|uniref:uncharacterized protein LOC129754722 isoform X2 n=1 Tax=Uranotaenia lowii TaxID=190385 RepID=UPI002479A145|nr:uncharacterized protein LOC129754722 isoform X2 [Uranotaenia lowii]
MKVTIVVRLRGLSLLLPLILAGFISCSPLASSADKSPSDREDATTPASDSVPPLIFPRDSTVYKIAENDTALRILQARSAEPAATTATVTEPIDTVKQINLNIGNELNSSLDTLNVNGSTTTAPIDGYDEEDDDDDDDYSDEDDLDDDVESVQPVDPNREEGLEEQYGDKSHYPFVIDNSSIEMTAMRQEHVWIIMVGAIIVAAVALYIGMTLYRNRLERYGMRQRLVTEDDYYTNNDI